MAVPFPENKLLDGIRVYEGPPATLGCPRNKYCLAAQ
jgi:hypothetical protein